MSARAVVAVFVLALAACEASANPGTACERTSDCRGPLVCRFGRCRPECAINADCPVGSACLLGADGQGACGLATDLGCTTSGTGRTCAIGLVCVNDTCERPCTDASQCPTDGVCLPIGDGTRFCFDGRASADAALPDVGPRDAGTDAPPIDAAILRDGVLDACIGARSACALSADRRVYCWGSSALGQLGEGGTCTSTGTTRPTPTTAVAGLTGVDAIACGQDFNCAHTADGSVMCWGANDAAQLGRGAASACEASAMPVQGLSAVGAHTLDLGRGGSTIVLQLAGQHGCVLASGARTLSCWGTGGMVFPTSMSATTVAVPFSATEDVPGAYTVATLALGADDACVTLDEAGGTFCWGDDSWEQLAIQSNPAATANRVVLDGVSLTLGSIGTSACTLDFVGVVWCWGDAREARLGDVATNIIGVDSTCGPTHDQPCIAQPQPISGNTLLFSQTSSSPGGTSCGIVSADTNEGAGAGEIMCWGPNAHLQAGVAGGQPAAIVIEQPVHGIARVDGVPLTRVAFVVAGDSASCAVDQRGLLSCWGDVDFDGNAPSEIATDVVVPVQR